jgi:hypothetical protein
MKKVLIYLQLLIFLAGPTILLAAPTNATGDTIKQKLKTEVSLLRKDIAEADSTVDKLYDDKAKIESNLRDMEAWGIGQQKDKDLYYSETVEVKKQAADQEASYTSKIERLKAKIESDMRKYHRLKSIACYFVAVAVVLLYLRFGAHLFAALIPLTGPWSIAFTFGGPVGAFALGYSAVYLLF